MKIAEKFRIADKFRKYRLVPVVVVNSVQEAETVLGGLCDGGLAIAEICFRTPCAEEVLRFAVKNFPKMLIGAGTVINGEQCIRAIQAGAKFIVSPGISEEAALICMQKAIPYLPGVVTSTEIIKAISLEIPTVKFFPAENVGGLKGLKAVAAAFPQMTFVPTGGINQDNLAAYLSFDKVIACGGSWMTKGTREEIARKTRLAVTLTESL